jgi:hypothetical protein
VVHYYYNFIESYERFRVSPCEYPLTLLFKRINFVVIFFSVNVTTVSIEASINTY